MSVLLCLSCNPTTTIPASNTLLDASEAQRIIGIQNFDVEYRASVSIGMPSKDMWTINSDMLNFNGYAYGATHKSYYVTLTSKDYISFKEFIDLKIDIDYDFTNNMNDSLFNPSFMNYYEERLTSGFIYLYYEYQRLGTDEFIDLKYSDIDSVIQLLTKEELPLKLRIRFAFYNGNLSGARESGILYVPNDAKLKNFKSTIYGYYK